MPKAKQVIPEEAPTVHAPVTVELPDDAHGAPVTPPPTPPTPPASDRPGATTPAMKQYLQFKSQYPTYVLFFRMGDFYEMFWEDAQLCHKVLGVTLTSRSRGGLDGADAIPMSGVPFHSVEGYLRKMIAAGHKVAICEQMEDPATAKGVIRREVVRLMTPGTLTDEPLLDGRELPRRRRLQRHQIRRLQDRPRLGRALDRPLRRDQRHARPGPRRDRPSPPRRDPRPRARQRPAPRDRQGH
jgi:hypothetical protein